MKLWKKAGLAILILVIALVLHLVYEFRQIEVEKLSDRLSVLRGAGGNATVIKTAEGTVVIDSMTFPMQGRLIRQKAQELTGQDVVMLINTHYHLDHTHGNPGFAPGIKVVATERTLSHLETIDKGAWQDGNAEFLPNQTFSDQTTIELGDTRLRLIHPGRGHTDGDLVVLIEGESTVVVGDLFFNNHYPNIDLEAGGSVQEWGDTLDNVLALEFERVIPGHGKTSDKNGLRSFQTFIRQLAQIGREAAKENTSLDETENSAKLTTDQGYEELSIGIVPLGLNRKFVLRRAWEETHNAFERKN